MSLRKENYAERNRDHARIDKFAVYRIKPTRSMYVLAKPGVIFEFAFVFLRVCPCDYTLFRLQEATNHLLAHEGPESPSHL